MFDPLKDVPADSSPVDDPDLDIENAPDVGDDDDGKERPVENVRREMMRRQDSLRSEVMGELASIKELFRGEKPDPATTSDGPKTPSVAELKAMEGQVTEDTQKMYDDALRDAMIREEVDRRVSTESAAQHVQSMREDARLQATSRYSDLSVPGSDFRQEVETRLRQLGEGYMESNPRAILDAANDVAAERGITAAVVTRQRVPGMTPASSRSNAAPTKGGTETVDPDEPSDEEISTMAAKLRSAMPNKEFSPEAIKRIKESTAVYKRGIHTRIKG